MTLSSVCSLSTTFLLLGSASGFVGPSGVAQQQQQHMNNNIRTTAAASQQRHKQTSKLFIEKWVADMIDEELWRENHKEDYERAWMEKNRAAVLQSFGMNNDNMMMRDDSEAIEYRQLLRDKKLARENPQQYCADRCIATGYCDVYEDM